MDKCVEKVLKKAEKANYNVLVTADHGNCELMRSESGEPNTAHTFNRVFCVVAGGKHKMKKFGGLVDVAPTVLDLMCLKKPKVFEGQSLILNEVDK